MILRDGVITDIIRDEAGYVNDPSDSGGETNFGITIAEARASGYTGSMRAMPRSVAERIYVARYWDKVNADALARYSADLAREVVDTGVNCGTHRAGTFLQRALNVFNNRGDYYPDIVVDGDIGPGTLRALDDFVDKRGVSGLKVLTRTLDCMQGAFYVELAEKREKDERFVYGWIKNRTI